MVPKVGTGMWSFWTKSIYLKYYNKPHYVTIRCRRHLSSNTRCIMGRQAGQSILHARWIRFYTTISLKNCFKESNAIVCGQNNMKVTKRSVLIFNISYSNINIWLANLFFVPSSHIVRRNSRVLHSTIFLTLLYLECLSYGLVNCWMKNRGWITPNIKILKIIHTHSGR